MSTSNPPDPAQGQDNAGSATPSGPVRYPTGQPSFPYSGSSTQPGLGQPYAPPPSSQPAYMPPPAVSSYPPPAASYAPPSQPYQQGQPSQAAYQYAQAAPPPSVPGAKPNYVGLIIALAGNITVVISFFALPLVSVGLLGSYTAIQVINLINEAYSVCSSLAASGASSASCPSFNYGLLLWLPVVAGAVSVLIAGIAWLGSASSGTSASRGGSIAVMLVSIGGGLALGFLLFGTSSIGNSRLDLVVSVLGSGFWLMVVGFITGVVGAIVQLASGH